ncbi:MAG TPA: YceI family protein [Steroidobacteraceae bacterium]
MNPFRTALAALGLAVAASGAAVAAPIAFVPNPNHTFVRFSYDHFGFSRQQSRFDKITGTVTLDPVARTGAVDLLIDTKSIDTGSALFNEHIQKPEFLDTGQYPTATFKSTAVKFKGDAPVTIIGNLTLKGITRPLTIHVTSFKHALNTLRQDSIGANATAIIKRSDYQMAKYVPLVSDDLDVSIAIEAATAGSTPGAQ